MTYLRNLYHDAKLSIGAGWAQWCYLRHYLRRGVNPDVWPVDNGV